MVVRSEGPTEVVINYYIVSTRLPYDLPKQTSRPADSALQNNVLHTTG